VSHANIRERVHTLASRGIVPVILGGDHSITWPAATAVADVHGYGNVGIVHFDAHADTADVVEVSPAYDHAELTVNAAHRVVFEALAGMAARRRDAANAKPGPPAR
jgi:arginase family enzyme